MAPRWDRILSMTCSRFLLCNMTRTSQDVMAPPQIQLILTFFGQQTENQCFIPRGLSVNLFCLNILSDLCKRIMEPIITKFLNYENIRCVYSTKFTKNHRRICTIFGGWNIWKIASSRKICSSAKFVWRSLLQIFSFLLLYRLEVREKLLRPCRIVIWGVGGEECSNCSSMWYWW